MTLNLPDLLSLDLVPLLALGGLVPVAIYWFFRQREKERTHRISEVGISLGYMFEERSPGFLKQLPKFQVLDIGRGRKARNILRGKLRKGELTLFDHQFTTGRGRHTRTSKQTVAYVSQIHLTCTDFSMRPETLLHRLTATFGYQDIDFTSHPEFSQAYLLRGKNEQAVRQLFQPHVLSFFEIFRNWVVEVKDGDLVCCRDRTLVEPDELRAFVADVETILAVIS